MNISFDIVKNKLLQFNVILCVYVTVTILASVQKLLLPPIQIGEKYYTTYNNYKIFKSSAHHLLDQTDLYKLYPEEHFDYYKYSPSFSFFFLPFGFLPDSIGLVIWNLLNVLLLFYAVIYIPSINDRHKAFILWFILLELLTSMQNSQSNGLMAALMIFAFILFEKKNVFLAALMIVFSVYIKLFGIVLVLLFLFYEDKIKFLYYFLFWMIIISLIPLILIKASFLINSYGSWMNLLSMDHANSYGISIMRVINAFLNIKISKYLSLVLGSLILLIPLINYKSFNKYIFRLLFLSFILIWVVIFNHKAESPLFIIAVCGAGIWFFTQQTSKINLVLLIITFIITSLSPTDIFVRYIRENIIFPYALKVVPCFLIWIKILYELILDKYKPNYILHNI